MKDLISLVLSKIMSFFSMFDWTFLFSGFTTAIILFVFGVNFNMNRIDRYLNLISSYWVLFFNVVYILGLFSWSVGSLLRKCILFRLVNLIIGAFKIKLYWRSIEEVACEVAKEAYNECGMSSEVVTENNVFAKYSKEWSLLRKDDSKKESYNYICQLHTRQSIMEGLIGSMIVAVSMILMSAINNWFCAIPLLFILFFTHEARDLAEKQIRDVITSNHVSNHA